MSQPQDPPSLELLLAQERWVRELARKLVGPDPEADDVAQSALATAIERPPLSGESAPILRAWLAQVVRRPVIGRHRADLRRIQRERDAAREESLSSASEIQAQEEERRIVVEALLALSEPYRTTLVLRYYRGLEPRAIARRLGVPDATVRTRLARGLQQLKQKLEARQGEDWRAGCALLALPNVPAIQSWGIGKGIVMGMKLKVALCVASLGVAALTWQALRRPGPQDAARAAEALSTAASRRDPADGAKVPETASAGTPARTPSEREPVEHASPADSNNDIDHPLIGDVLKQFWGARWDEVRPKYEECIPLTTRMQMRLPAWAEVEPQVCELMKMSDVELAGVEQRYLPPNPITIAYLGQRYVVDKATWTDADTTRLEVELQDVRSDGAQALDAYRRAIDGALRARCVSRRYDHMPIANIENPSMPSDAIYAGTFAISGWVISVGVGLEEAPQLAEAKSSLETMKQRTARAIARFLAARK